MNIGIFPRFFGALQRSPSAFKQLTASNLRPSVLTTQPVREKNRRARQRKKHYDIKFAALRGAKVYKMELPDYADLKEKQQRKSPEEQRAEIKKEGRLPPRSFQERPLNISASSDVFEPYIPPDGDGMASIISKEGASQRALNIQKRGKSILEMRKIKSYDETFDSTQFVHTALEIYKQAHDLLQDVKKNELYLHNLVTEKAYPEMTYALDKKTFRWKFIEMIEPSRIVHVRTNDMLTKGNLYGQVTIRLHTKQTLAIYDRFGRLMYGGENIIKDILEYVVYERHLSNEYGIWRLHTKVVPDWMPPRQPAIRTYVELPKQSEIQNPDVVVDTATV